MLNKEICKKCHKEKGVGWKRDDEIGWNLKFGHVWCCVIQASISKHTEDNPYLPPKDCFHYMEQLLLGPPDDT